MEWYEGDIPKAISTAKQNRAILVVFIAGNDEDSHLMYASLQDSTVSGKLKDNCVALKLNSDSDSLKQFSQIYHVAAIPSTYFIGVKGVPLEVVCENVDVSRLLEKIDGVIRVHQQQINEASSAIPRESEEALPESSVTGSASVLLSSNHESVSMVTQDQPSSEERMKRAKLLASQLRAKRLAEEMEEEKRKEIERRNMGKQFQMLQRRNEELDPKLVAEEIARKKAEDRAIRQRVREQIAQDRAEIAARCNAQKAAEEIRNQEMVQAKPRTKQENASTEAAKESRSTVKEPPAIPREPEEALPESIVTGSASVLLSSNHESVSMVTQDQPSSEERMKRDKVLALQLRAKRLAEEMEEEKRKEIERRNMGKQFQMLQRRNEELDPKLVAEEIARKKAEDRAIRKRVREQIAQDRAEIAARCNAQKAAEKIRNQEMVQAKPRTKQGNASTEAAKERAQIAPRYNAQKVEEEKVNQEMVKGVPLEVICESVDVSRVLEKIDGVIRLHQQQINEASSAIPREPEEALPESIMTGSASVLLSSDHESASMVTQDPPSSEEQMTRDKVVASQLRAKRLAEEMEEEKRKEIERRNMGKQFQLLQRRKEELDAKLVAEEIARKKAEERAIRQRVHEQIAQDRAEIAARCNAQKAAEKIRNQEMVQAKPRTEQGNASTEAAKERAQIAPRYNAQKAEEEKVNQEMVKAKLRAEQEEATAEAAKKRLQFRLPDGSSVTQQFDADSSLQVVHDFVKEAVKPPFTPFTLSVAIPLRTFQKSDYSQLLRDLHVPPSAAILVHPVKSGTKQQGGSNRILRFLWLLLSPLL